MSIVALSEAVVRRLVPRVVAGACLPSDPCGQCLFRSRGCSGSGCYSFYYSTMRTDCNGRCTIVGSKLCKMVRTGMCSASCR